MMNITADEFKMIAGYVRRISGISLDERKAYLIETRLRHLVRDLGCGSFGELYSKVLADRTGTAERKIIDAIVTNETLFFRDRWPFELLRDKILPDLTTENSRRLRIWFAGCSTGQEVYSAVIVLKESVPDLKRYDTLILGTDISGQAIDQARRGLYNQFEIERGLSRERLLRYFVSEGNNWKIRDHIRAVPVFRRHNLMKPLSGSGRFDIVFCRNVSIYFDSDGQKRLFENIANVMDPGAYLITGATESVLSISSRFEPGRHLRSFFYRLK